MKISITVLGDLAQRNDRNEMIQNEWVKSVTRVKTNTRPC